MLLEEIGALLQASGIGTLGTDLFLALMPDTPDNCTAIIEYAGSPNEYTFGASTGAAFENPRFQVLTRGATYPGARAKIESIYKLLDAVTEQTLSGVQYHRIQSVQAPFGMPRDINNRYLMACNFEATKDVS